MINLENKNKTIILLAFCLIAFLVASIFLIVFFQPFPLKYIDEIKYCSQRHNVSPYLIASVIKTESGFKEDAKSPRGAIGLMQILPTTAEWLCGLSGKTYYKEMLYNPYNNIDIGTYYLKYLFNKFSDLDTVLASYNAGEGNVKLWLLNEKYSFDGKTINITPYEETNNYIKKVHSAMEVYQEKFKSV